MRHLLLAIMVAAFIPATVQASEEFGQYFANQSPAGFGDPAPSVEFMANQATALQDIAPAAGDEDVTGAQGNDDHDVLDLPGSHKGVTHNGYSPSALGYIKDDLSP
jgi:hypothetical protein